MPANWPGFIAKVSSKLESREITNHLEFGKYFAQEYFNAVKTSQTPFGNIHSSGQKVILEVGFTAAFVKLFTFGDLELLKKRSDERYSDMVEPLPEPDFSYDMYCDLEKWIDDNQDTIDPFKFHSFFPSTCPIEKEPTSLAGDFNFSVVQGAQELAEKEPVFHVVRFEIKNFDTSQSYKANFTLNGKSQDSLAFDSEGRIELRIPSTPGKYLYNFVSILDSEGKEIKKVNKDRSITIGDGGIVSQLDSIDQVISGDAQQYPEKMIKEPRQFLPEMTESQKIDYIAKRVAYQNDGTDRFKNWVKRLKLGYNTTIGEAVADLVLTKYKDLRKQDNTLNSRFFQEENEVHPDNLPEWLTSRFISKFVYDFSTDGPNTGGTLQLRSFFEQSRTNTKVNKYNSEKERWNELLRRYAGDLEQKFKEEYEEFTNIDAFKERIKDMDAYDIMALTIMVYWISTLVKPFSAAPPVLPCTLPTPGTYIPVYYGSMNSLSKDLRRAWNMGKMFDYQIASPLACKLTASAVAVSCAKHLALLKFVYVGSIPSPVGPVPMVGFVPIVF